MAVALAPPGFKSPGSPPGLFFVPRLLQSPRLRSSICVRVTAILNRRAGVMLNCLAAFRPSASITGSVDRTFE